MANFTKITPIDMGVYRNKFLASTTDANFFKAVASNGASSAKYGAYFEMDARDDKYLIIFKNTTSGEGAKDLDVKVIAGNDKVFGAVSDVTLTDLGDGEYTCIKVDSGKFKQIDNTNKNVIDASGATSVKGCCILETEATGTTGVSVAVIKMPF